MSPRIGALFAGYGGLDQAVQEVYGGDLAWYSEIDKGALKILGHRFPDVPNVGDVTAVDWASVEPVDILTGGSPCQDLSHAGKRQGMTEGTRSNLWVAMREAIAVLRPSIVIWENVRGAYSASADSELVTRPGLLDSVRRRDGEPVLRALGRVLGDLSDLGYDARWHGLRAADVGAPHGRFRVFLVATDTGGVRRGARRPAVTGEAAGGRPLGDVAGRGLLPTPTTRDHKDGQVRRDPHRPDAVDTLSRALALLPTPAVNDMGAAYTPETWDAWCAVQQEKHGNGNGHGKSLAIEAQRLLPTPQAFDGVQPDRTLAQHYEREARLKAANPNLGGLHLTLPTVATAPETWGQYAAAIARWEHVLGRPAPAPTMTSKKGNPQLSPAFVEWLMGLPAGWVTDTPGITRNEALRALGNGVVPQQCAAALRYLASVEAAA